MSLNVLVILLVVVVCVSAELAFQSSTRSAGGAASRAIDGNKDSNFGGNSCTHTTGQENSPWWYLDFGATKTVTSVSITNRQDCCADRLSNFDVAVTSTPPPVSFSTENVCASHTSSVGRSVTLPCGSPKSGRYLVIRLRDTGAPRVLTLCEVESLSVGESTGLAFQSSTRAAGGAASRAIDGNKNGNFGGNSCTHTAGTENSPWWYMDLGHAETVTSVTLTNRADCCRERLVNFDVAVVNTPPPTEFMAPSICATQKSVFSGSLTLVCLHPPRGRYLAIRLRNTGARRVLTLCEVEYTAQVQAVQSSTRQAGGAAERAIDGIIDGRFSQNGCTHTNAEPRPWWLLNIGHQVNIKGIDIVNRVDCCADRLKHFKIAVFKTFPTRSQIGGVIPATQLCHSHGAASIVLQGQFNCVRPITGRYVAIIMNNTGENNRILTLCEVLINQTK